MKPSIDVAVVTVVSVTTLAWLVVGLCAALLVRRRRRISDDPVDARGCRVGERLVLPALCLAALAGCTVQASPAMLHGAAMQAIEVLADGTAPDAIHISDVAPGPTLAASTLSPALTSPYRSTCRSRMRR